MAHRDLAAAQVVATLRSFGLYSMVGLLSLAADLSVFAVLVHPVQLHPLVANAVSRPIGGVVCFFANKYWTFGNHDSPIGTQFLRFWGVFGMSLALSEGLLWLLHDFWSWPPTLSKLGAEGTVVVFNYLCLRFWTFR